MARGSKRLAGNSLQRQKVTAQLDALYAELPALPCKGKCSHSCAGIVMAPGERERIKLEGGVTLPTFPGGPRPPCPALKDDRCTVHQIRPMMCRMWGIADWMRCPHGCKPEGGWMSEQETVRFFLRTHLIAGWPTEAEEKLTRTQIAQRLQQIEQEFEINPPRRIESETERHPFHRRWRRSRS
jgi:Fe-S-cluster containining protein